MAKRLRPLTGIGGHFYSTTHLELIGATLAMRLPHRRGFGPLVSPWGGCDGSKVSVAFAGKRIVQGFPNYAFSNVLTLLGAAL
jgi:hypothetical protein